ncbi:MAG: DUF3603 family protein [Firmicutes bacterium]|nr:DUF3603 family protein [Bacillota bacterium]
MNYYYDLLLNFQDKYCMFYEWDQEDSIEFIKKIPLFHIDSKAYIDLLTKRVILNENFLQSIENKTKIKQNNYLKYTSIFSDGKNSIVLEFNDDGLVINKSSLMLEDELNINEFMYSIKLSPIDYKVVDEDKISKETRQELKIKRLLKIEIENMYQKKEFSKLKYIYLEWFNELIDNIDKMYNKMLTKIGEDLTEKEYAIYELIKLSYNNV